MVLTKRDLEILGALQSYAIFTTRQIAAKYFLGARATTVLRRLRKLERAFYIQRVTGLDGGEVAWSLTQKGAGLAGGAAYKRHFRRDVLDHDLKLTALRLLLEDQGVAHSWIPEHEIRAVVARKHGLRAMRERIVPDGIMGVEASGCKESIAMELELHFKNRDRYLRTFRQYQEKSNLWGVWYFVASAGIGRQVERLWREANVFRADIRFFWSVLGEVEAKTLTGAVHGYGAGNEIRSLFALEEMAGAHTPAQGVSKKEEGKEEHDGGLNAENETELLAPVG